MSSTGVDPIDYWDQNPLGTHTAECAPHFEKYGECVHDCQSDEIIALIEELIEWRIWNKKNNNGGNS